MFKDTKLIRDAVESVTANQRLVFPPVFVQAAVLSLSLIKSNTQKAREKTKTKTESNQTKMWTIKFKCFKKYTQKHELYCQLIL